MGSSKFIFGGATSRMEENIGISCLRVLKATKKKKRKKLARFVLHKRASI